MNPRHRPPGSNAFHCDCCRRVDLIGGVAGSADLIGECHGKAPRMGSRNQLRRVGLSPQHSLARGVWRSAQGLARRRNRPFAILWVSRPNHRCFPCKRFHLNTSILGCEGEGQYLEKRMAIALRYGRRENSPVPQYPDLSAIYLAIRFKADDCAGQVMEIPIEGDVLRIRDGDRVLLETCFESRSDWTNIPRVRRLSVFTKWPYQLGKRYCLLGSGTELCSALVHSVQISGHRVFNRVTF